MRVFLVLAVATGGLAGVGCALDSSSAGGAAVGPARHSHRGVRRYTDPAGWSISYSSAVRLERSSGADLASFYEVTVASFVQRQAIHTGVNHRSGAVSFSLPTDPPLNARGRFPASAVAIRILRIVGGPVPPVVARLELSDQAGWLGTEQSTPHTTTTSTESPASPSDAATPGTT